MLLKILNVKTEIIFTIFCISFFLLRLPPINLFGIESSFTSTHSLVRYIHILIFIFLLIDIKTRNKITSIQKQLSYLILFYIFAQSLSVIRTVNISQFLLIYKNIIFGILTFLITKTLVTRNNIHFLIKTLILTFLINFVYQFFIYFYPQIVYLYLKPFFDQNYWQYFDYQYQRHRFFGDMLDEPFLPIIFYIIISSRSK